MEWLLIAMGIAGAAAGLFGTYQGLQKEHDSLRRQRDSADAHHKLSEALAERQYGIQKGEAAYQLGEREAALREGVGMFTEQHNALLLAQAFGEQDARIQAASGMGGHAAAEAAGGTRGNAANGLTREYAARGLERGLEAQRLQNQSALRGALAEAGRAQGAIAHERESWEEGGYRHALKAAQDKYDKATAQGLKDNYGFAMGQSDPWNFEANGWDYLTGFFSGGASGAGMAHDIYRYGRDW